MQRRRLAEPEPRERSPLAVVVAVLVLVVLALAFFVVRRELDDSSREEQRRNEALKELDNREAERAKAADRNREDKAKRDNAHALYHMGDRRCPTCMGSGSVSLPQDTMGPGGRHDAACLACSGSGVKECPYCAEESRRGR
jgi:hypothetical protein